MDKNYFDMIREELSKNDYEIRVLSILESKVNKFKDFQREKQLIIDVSNEKIKEYEEKIKEYELILHNYKFDFESQVEIIIEDSKIQPTRLMKTGNKFILPSAEIQIKNPTKNIISKKDFKYSEIPEKYLKETKKVTIDIVTMKKELKLKILENGDIVDSDGVIYESFEVVKKEKEIKIKL